MSHLEGFPGRQVSWSSWSPPDDQSDDRIWGHDSFCWPRKTSEVCLSELSRQDKFINKTSSSVLLLASNADVRRDGGWEPQHGGSDSTRSSTTMSVHTKVTPTSSATFYKQSVWSNKVTSMFLMVTWPYSCLMDCTALLRSIPTSCLCSSHLAAAMSKPNHTVTSLLGVCRWHTSDDAQQWCWWLMVLVKYLTCVFSNRQRQTWEWEEPQTKTSTRRAVRAVWRDLWTSLFPHSVTALLAQRCVCVCVCLKITCCCAEQTLLHQHTESQWSWARCFTSRDAETSRAGAHSYDWHSRITCIDHDGRWSDNWFWRQSEVFVKLKLVSDEEAEEQLLSKVTAGQSVSVVSSLSVKPAGQSSDCDFTVRSVSSISCCSHENLWCVSDQILLYLSI